MGMIDLNLHNDKILILSELFFYHRIFLNGEQIFLVQKCLDNLNEILEEFLPKNKVEIFSLYNTKIIKRIYRDFIPEDAVLFNSEEINNIQKGNIIKSRHSNENYFICFPIYNFYSEKSFVRINKEPSLPPLSGLKILRQINDNFQILEYPQNKEGNYYSIIIFGEDELNKEFIDSYLNFLYHVNIDDNFRLILKKNYTKDFIKIYYIIAFKENYKFICVNMGENINTEHLVQFLETLKNEKINLIVFNRLEMVSEPIFEFEEYEKYDIFFACPSISFNILKCLFLQKEIKFLDKLNLIFDNKADYNNIKEIILETAKFDKILTQKFVSCFFNCGCICDYHYHSYFSEINKGDKNLFFIYKITMEGFAYFHNIIIQERTNKFIDFSFIVNYLSKIPNELKEIENKKKMFLDGFYERQL